MDLLDDNLLYKEGNEKSIESILQEGYETHSMDYIKEGWEIFKKNPGFFIGFFIVNLLIGGVFNYLPDWVSILQIVITPCLVIGFFQVAKKIDQDEAVEFSNFFDGFKVWERAIPFYVLMLLFLILAFILLVLPGIYLGVGYLFAFPLIALYSQEQPLIDVLENSRKIISKKWLNWFGFCWLLLLFNIVGLLCLIVGVFVTSMVSYIAIYCAYKDVVGIN